MVVDNSVDVIDATLQSVWKKKKERNLIILCNIQGWMIISSADSNDRTFDVVSWHEKA